MAANRPTTKQCLLILSVLLFDSFVQLRSMEPNKDECACENLKEFGPRIVNGTSSDALRNGLPWLAFLYVWEWSWTSGYYFRCTAVVISWRWVLTGKHTSHKAPLLLQTNLNRPFYRIAKHCIRPSQAWHYVGAGLDHDAYAIRYETENYREVVSIRYFGADPKEFIDDERKVEISYDLMKSDVALLELKSPFKFGPQTRIYPACLMDYERTKFENELVAAGYGITEQFTDQDLPALKPSKWPEVKMTKLRQTFEDKYFIVANSSHSSMCFGICENRRF